MKSELHSAKSFRRDYKKLSKSEVEDTDDVIKKLLNNEVLDPDSMTMICMEIMKVIENVMFVQIYF